jgi:hypothetical protein
MIEHPLLDSSSVLTKSFSSFSGGRLKRGLVFVLVVLLLVGSGVFISWWQGRDGRSSEVVTDIQKLDIESSVIPDGIPQDMPFLSQGRVLYNYVADSPSGSHFSVRKWESSGDRKSAVQDFKKFLESGGWQILTFSEQDKFTLLGASLNGTSLSIVLSEGVEKNTFIVEASATSPKI